MTRAEWRSLRCARQIIKALQMLEDFNDGNPNMILEDCKVLLARDKTPKAQEMRNLINRWQEYSKRKFMIRELAWATNRLAKKRGKL